MRALDKKLARDLLRLRYQGLTIALLVGCGIASFVAAVATSVSMQATRDAFYRDARFGDVFDTLRRAPRSALDRLRDLPFVDAVDGRVVSDFRLAMRDSSEPVTARFVSIGWPAGQRLNEPSILVGRQVEPGRPDEVVVSDAFARAWDLVPGAVISAVIKERRSDLRIVGIATSPEFVFAAAPRTGLPDPRHFGIVWMDEDALSKATGSVGAFNDVVLRLRPGADLEDTRLQVDRALEAYGGLGSVGRADQPSAKLVDQKMAQLAKLARTLPLVFLAIAAFLQNVLLSRIVGTEREQIATLKALGYRSRELAFHYLELALSISGLGAVLGTALGLWGAHAMLWVYARYFAFPVFVFRMPAGTIAGGAAFAIAVGVGGSLLAVLRAVAVPPAEAMRPEAPQGYRSSRLDGLYRLVPPVLRMVLRDMQRRPARLLLSALSIALATSIVLAGRVLGDSMDAVLRLQFEVSHREQVALTLDNPRSVRALEEVGHIEGVIHVEGERVVPVRLRAGNRVRSTVLLGLDPDADLHVLMDGSQRRLDLPPEGLGLSRALADALGIGAGDTVDLEVLQSDRRTRLVHLAAVIDDFLGMYGYMNGPALARLLGEQPQFDTILAAVDARDVDAVSRRVGGLPDVAAISQPAIDEGLVREEVADEFVVLSVVLSLFAAAIAIGVVYNNARIALEVRARDLATMRILGFTRKELGVVLLGEQAVQIALGVGPGLWVGRALGALWIQSIDHELLRIPLRVVPTSYAMAALVVVIAAWASALVVRRHADRLDLVSVLKARD